MIALDLFCGAGGAAMGLLRAGFDVVGVDCRPIRNYPGRFVQGDALNPPVDLSQVAFIWASPPCQRYLNVTAKRGDRDRHPDLIGPTRDLLQRSGVPWAIENVRQAPIRPDLILSGDLFGLNTYRVRVFELSFFALQPGAGVRFGPATRPGAVTVCGHPGGASGRVEAWREAMGIDWKMPGRELANAIPPAYAEYVGRAAIGHITEGRAFQVTKPLSDYARARLREIVRCGPIPRQQVNPGAGDRLMRDGLIKIVDAPSPFRHHKKRPIQHYVATAEGLALVQAEAGGAA